MNGYLVDTNIPSELTRTRPDPRVEAFLRAAGTAVHLSVLSVGEIRKGIELLPDSSRRVLLEQWLDTEIRLWFGDRILPVTIGVAERWGAIAANAKRAGRPLPVLTD